MGGHLTAVTARTQHGDAGMTDAQRMMGLFAGWTGAHGTYRSTEKNSAKGGKLEIKKTARTVREPVTVQLWEQHLSGERPLGIIPINEQDQCVWGCVDVDRYDINLADTVKQVNKLSLPLIICRTKSGGAHAFLFTTEPVPAEQMRDMLRQMASTMGWGDCEIFPKQNRILSDRGDLGNWLNMPYLAGDKTDRYCVKESMAAYSVDEFLDHAEKSKFDPSRGLKIPKPQDETLGDGPPCLEHLAAMGFPDGTRNNGLFALAIFCKKKYGSTWTEMLEKYNRDFMKPPLTSEEVQGVIQNVEKKDYNYSCKDQPLCSHCNSSLCRTRKFGVGGSGLFPAVSGLSKLDSEPPLWFLDIEDERVELTTDELQNYRMFQKACMERLTVFYMPMKADTWASTVGEAMQNAIIIEASPDMSVHGHFMELLEDFCVNKHKGERVEDLWLGKPWEDDGKHYFRLQDLMKFLDTHNFRAWGRNKVGNVLDEIGGRQFLNVKGKGVNTFWVPAVFDQIGELPLPESRREHI